WVEVNNIMAGANGRRYDLRLTRGRGFTRITLRTQAQAAAQTAPPSTLPQQLIVNLPLPLDAQWRGSEGGHARSSVLMNYGAARRAADMALVEVRTNIESDGADLNIRYDEGTDVYVEPQTLLAGASSAGLRLLRAHAEGGALRLSLEGLAGRSYTLGVRTSRRLGAADGVRVEQSGAGDAKLT